MKHLKLDFQKLMDFSDFKFKKNVFSIMHYCDFKTGLFFNFFIPACARDIKGDGNDC